MIESGWPEVDVVTWYAVVTPAGIPELIQARLCDACTGAAATPEIRRLLDEQGLITLPNTRESFARRIAAESDRWARIIRDRRTRVE